VKQTEEIAENVPPRNTSSGTVQPQPAEVSASKSATTSGPSPGYAENKTPEPVTTTDSSAAQQTQIAQVIPRKVGDVGTSRVIPVPPQPQPPATANIPASGTIQWSLELRKGETASLTGSQLSTGRLLSGQELPGVPVAVSIQPPNVAGVIEAPGPSNGWKTLKLRGMRDTTIVISIQWRRL
jgi:hypothetical protein